MKVTGLKKITFYCFLILVVAGFMLTTKKEKSDKKLSPEELAILTTPTEDRGNWDYLGENDDLTGKLILRAEARDKSQLATLTVRDHPRQGVSVFISWSKKLPPLYLKDGLPRTVSIAMDGIEGVTQLPFTQADDIGDPATTTRAIFLKREKELVSVIEKNQEMRVEIPLEGLGKETFIFPIDKFDRKKIKR
ncbi:MAG: hypothetical protein ACKN9J_04710 [Holophagaceae bacterium]